MRTVLIVLALFLAAPDLVRAACTLQSASELTAKLTWTNADTVTTDTINILRSNSAGAETLLINIPYGTTYTDTVPAPNVSQITYFYEVQAKGPGGVSAPSTEGCKTFFGPPPTPTNVTVQ